MKMSRIGLNEINMVMYIKYRFVNPVILLHILVIKGLQSMQN